MLFINGSSLGMRVKDNYVLIQSLKTWLHELKLDFRELSTFQKF